MSTEHVSRLIYPSQSLAVTLATEGCRKGESASDLSIKETTSSENIPSAAWFLESMVKMVQRNPVITTFVVGTLEVPSCKAKRAKLWERRVLTTDMVL